MQNRWDFASTRCSPKAAPSGHNWLGLEVGNALICCALPLVTLLVAALLRLVVVVMPLPGVIRTNNAPKVRFSATLGKEPEIELGLV